MTTALPDPLRHSLRDYLHSKIGLLFTEKQDSELFRKIGLAAPAFGHHDPVRFAEWLIVDTVTDKQLGDLASYLTIGETYFFREKKSFDFLEQIYLPELIRKRYESERRLSVWCAGCATGEEAYSLAIALTQSIPDIHRWNISILATDINPLFLEKARLGIYKKWSFRTNTPEFIRKYFTTAGENEFHIRPEIKKLVKFSSLNLAEDCYPSSVNKTQSSDIIFCRNVLIYFSPEGNKFVTERLYNSLINGGILVVSPVEMTGMIYPKFNKITYSGFTIYQKGAHHREEKSKVLSGLHVPVPKPPVTLKELKKEQPIKVEEPQKYLRHPEETREKERLKQEPIKESPGENDYSNAESLFFKGAFEEAELLLTRLVADSQDSCNPALLLLAKAKANLGKLKEA